MSSGLANAVKSKGEKPLKLYTHPSGQPCMLRENIGERMVKLGWKMGYNEKKKKGTTAFPDGDPALFKEKAKSSQPKKPTASPAGQSAAAK